MPYKFLPAANLAFLPVRPGAFWKVFDNIKLRGDAALQLSAQKLHDIVIIDEDEFNKRVAEHEASRQRRKHIRNLFSIITEDKSQ